MTADYWRTELDRQHPPVAVCTHCGTVVRRLPDYPWPWAHGLGLAERGGCTTPEPG